MQKVAAALVISLAASTIEGCGAPQKPATFATRADVASGVDVVARTLAAEGHAPPKVDRQAGIINTDWKDTGFLFGQIDHRPATIVRRFTVVLAPATDGSSVTVRMDAKRCARDGFSIDGLDVRGPCEELTVIPASCQAEVDALGSKLQGSLATSPQASPH